MIDEVLRKLIDFLQGASPLVWQSLIKQVYVEASARLAWALGFVVVTYFLFKLVNFKKAEYEKEYDDGRFFQDCGWAWVYAGIACTAITSFGLAVSSFMWFFNPEFYAIRFILQNIGGG